MNQTVVLVALGVLCSCVLAALALLALFLLNKGNNGGDAYKGLPSTPDTSGMYPETRRMAEEIAKSKSNCWDYNHWARVTLPDQMRAGDRLQMDMEELKKKSGGKLTSKQKDDILAQARSYADKVVKAQYAELGKCPGDTWVETTDGNGTYEKVNLKDRLESMQPQIDRYKSLIVRTLESNM